MTLDHEALLLQQTLFPKGRSIWDVKLPIFGNPKVDAVESVTIKREESQRSHISRLLLECIISGSTAGALGIVFSQPLDVIRVRLQTKKEYYQTISRTARIIASSEGIKGLFKGVASPVAGAGALNALLFAGFDGTEYLLTNGHTRDSGFQDWVIAGSVAGVVSAFVTSPTELISRLAQVDSKSQGSIREEATIARRIYQSQGIRGIFRGLGTTMTRDAMGFTYYFCVYKYLTRDTDSVARSFWAGGLAGSISWACIYPLDVLKTRWQVAPPGYFASPVHLFRHSLKSEGPGFMCKGLGATILRAFPQHAVTFVAYECLRGYLENI